ncbi:MAG: GNAT family N-acetyltransferase [Ferrimicrobium sp.]
MSIEVIRYSEKPKLWAETDRISHEVWPEYNLHGEHDWNRLFDDFPGYQFVLYDTDASEVLAEGHTIPCGWDGTKVGLGNGFDDMMTAALRAYDAGEEPSALCALAAEVRPRFQGRGLADRILTTMADLARQADLADLIAPVRPSLKNRYPITPVEEYVAWTRENGEPFDPWIRVHVRRGATVVKPVPHSLRVAGTVTEWEAWTGMRFPGDGSYVFPAGLAPLEIDHQLNRGIYWEPNVWMVHDLRRDQSQLP